MLIMPEMDRLIQGRNIADRPWRHFLKIGSISEGTSILYLLSCWKSSMLFVEVLIASKQINPAVIQFPARI